MMIYIFAALFVAALLYWRFWSEPRAPQPPTAVPREPLTPPVPVIAADDPKLLVATMARIFQAQGWYGANDDRPALVAALARDHAEALLDQSRDVPGEDNDPVATMSRLTRHLNRADPSAFTRLGPIFDDLGRTGGGVSPRQKQIWAEVARVLTLGQIAQIVTRA